MLKISYKEPDKKVSDLTVNELIDIIYTIMNQINYNKNNFQPGYFIHENYQPKQYEIYCHDGSNLDINA